MLYSDRTIWLVGIALWIASALFAVNRYWYQSSIFLSDSSVSHQPTTDANAINSTTRLAILLEEKKQILSQLSVVESQISSLSKIEDGTSPTMRIVFPQSIKQQQQEEYYPAITTCPYDFKVYVYDIPKSLPSVKYSIESRRNQSLHICQKCILEQFSLEYIVLDFFTQFCGRTWNPDEADYFYLPIVRDAEYRMTLQSNVRARAPSLTEQALIELTEKNDSRAWKEAFHVTDQYWLRKGGADHIIVMPAPVTNLRHESSKRGYFHYMSHLHSPIFLGVEYSLSFVLEYPVCSVQKNIMVPYPTTDPDFYNGKLFDRSIHRSGLLYYAGGLHGDCVEVRKAMKQLMSNSSRIPGVLPPIKRVMSEREHGFLAAVFCPIPIGDSPSSKRMYDVMNFGCIPVVLSDDLVWAFSDQTNGIFHHLNYSIHLPQQVIQYSTTTLLRKFKDAKESFGVLPSGTLLYDLLEQSHLQDPAFINGIYVNPLVKILQWIPKEDIATLQRGVHYVAPFFQFYAMNHSLTHIPTASHVFPSGGAIQMLASALSQRKAVGIDKIHMDCVAEKSRYHKYDVRYPCNRATAHGKHRDQHRYRRFI